MGNTTPYAGGFLVKTPYLDQLVNRLYAEQQQKNLQQRQDNKMLDEEFSRNLSGIWDADIPELTKKYSDYKQSWKNFYKKKGGGTPQEQLEVLKKKADMYSLLGNSKEHRGWWEGKVKTVQADKKGLFADDAAQQLVSMRGIPSSQVDRNAVEPKLLYPYSVPEFDKINKEAVGTLIERRGKPVKSVTDPLAEETPVWKTGNTPNQIYEHLLGSIMSKNLGKNYAGLVLHSMSDQEKEDITNKYVAKVNDPKFIAAYGEVKPFPQLALETPLGQAVALQTMKNVVDTPIPEPKIEKVYNKEAIMNKQQELTLKRQKEMAAIHDVYTMKHIGYKAALDLGNIIASDKYVDEIFNTMGNNLPADLVNKVFETPKDNKGHPFPPPSIKKSEDGKNYVFYYDDGKGGISYSKEVPVAIVKTQFKHDAGNALKTKTTIPAGTKTSGKKKITW